jgi:hypothetical protein
MVPATPNRLLAAERRNQVQVPLSEQIGGGVVGDVIVGQAAPALVRSRQHGRREIALRLDVEERAEVKQIEEILRSA